MRILTVLLTLVIVSPVFAQTPSEEKDQIFSMLAYSIMAKDWQSELQDVKRGHNIGAVLVNNDEPLAWAVNCNARTKNGTQHAEVRTITGYLKFSRIRNLTGHTVYTTLEPCAMCAGMICLTDVQRVVYGQTDPLFGQAFERLGMNSKINGIPYPRRPKEAVLSTTQFATRLDKYDPKVIPSIIDWLLKQEARNIFMDAQEFFLNYKVVNKENEAVRLRCIYFYNHLPEFNFSE